MTPAPGPTPPTLLDRAAALTRQGEFDGGGQLAREALQLFLARADRDGQMRAVNLLGAIAFERGEITAAARHFGEALSLAQANHDHLIAARASNNLASVLHLTGRGPEAVALYHTALASYQRIGDRRGVSETEHNLGIVHRTLGQLTEAADAATEAVRHARALGEPGLLGLVLTGRAEIELEQNSIGIARQLLRRAETLVTDADDAVGLAEIGHVRARILWREGQLKEAAAEARAAAALATSLGSALLAAECASVEAVVRYLLHETNDAERLRTGAVGVFAQKHASWMAARFQREWEAAIRLRG